MAYLLGVLFVAAGIAVSIALHEVGHLIPAKIFGLKVPEYMVGFGPKIWSTRRGETEYGIKAVPFGGYVRMIGMMPPRPGEDGTRLRASNTGRVAQMIDRAREDSMEEVAPADADRVFYKLSTPKKLVVMLGGPVMNLVIAVVLLGGILTFHGTSEQRPGAWVSSVGECVVPVPVSQQAAQSGTAVSCSTSDPKTPAYLAGIQPGDVITSIAGQPVSDANAVSTLVRPRAGQTVPVTLTRSGAQVSTTVTITTNQVYAVGSDGKPVLGADGQPQTQSAGFLGVSTGDNAEVVRQPVSAVPGFVGNALGQTAGVVLKLPQRMVDVYNAAFGSQARDVNGPMSIVGVGRLGGEIASAQAAPGQSDLLGDKIAFLVSLVASLNLALFVFNLIPLPPLDGGHVAGALWEGLKRTFARVAGRPDPGYVDVAKGLPIAFGVVALYLGMSVLLIYADLVKPIRL